jgi:hypothetical protein
MIWDNCAEHLKFPKAAIVVKPQYFHPLEQLLFKLHLLASQCRLLDPSTRYSLARQALASLRGLVNCLLPEHKRAHLEKVLAQQGVRL